MRATIIEFIVYRVLQSLLYKLLYLPSIDVITNGVGLLYNVDLNSSEMVKDGVEMCNIFYRF